MQRSNFAAMKKLTIKKVEPKHEIDDFVKLTDRLYDGCPYYVPDLRMDIRATFDPKKYRIRVYGHTTLYRLQ